MNIGINELIFESFFIVTWKLFHFTFFLLSCYPFMIFTLISFLEDIDFSIIWIVLSISVHLVVNTHKCFTDFPLFNIFPSIWFISFCYASCLEFCLIWGILLDIIVNFKHISRHFLTIWSHWFFPLFSFHFFQSLQILPIVL